MSVAAESMIGNIPSLVDHMKVIRNSQKTALQQKRNNVYTRLSFVVIGKSFKYVGKCLYLCSKHVYPLCDTYEEKQNRYGDKCQYAHGQEDLRDVERHPKYKTQVCRTFYQTGTCPYGTRCTFRHDENESHSSALLQRSQLQQPKLFHHHRNNRTCTYMTPAAWMTPHADAAQVSPTCPADSHNNVLLSSDAESLLPTGLLSDLDEPPSHIRPPVVGSLMLPCIPSSLVFQHGQQPFNHNIWKQHQGGSDSLGKGDLGTSTTTSSFL